MTGPDAKALRCAPCAPRSRCVLATADPEVLPESALVVQRVRFERGETIIREGTPSVGWAILCQGRAQVTVSGEDGKRLLLRFCGPGELLSGSLSGPHSFSVTAASRCVVGFIPREHVLDLGRRYPELLLAVHLRWEERERLLARRLADLAYVGTRQRLVRVLLELAQEHGEEEGGGVRIDLLLSLRDLAEMIGASAQATSQALQPLRAKGLVEAAWPRVFLRNPEGLRRLG